MAGVLTDAARGLELAPAHAAWRAAGWARLPGCATDQALAALRARADAIMAGAAPRDGLFFQHDAPTGAYDDLALGKGWIGPSPAYRKIEGLERDPVMRAWIDNPLFARIAHAVIGPEVALARAVLWTKAPASGTRPGGTELPWHQDGGRFWGLTAQPPLTLWTALDDAPVASGCVEVIPGSHRGGLVRPSGGVVPDAAVDAAAAVPVPAQAGDVVLLDTLVIHRSRRNHTAAPRRALAIVLMPASTRCTRTRKAPRQFVRLYG